MTIANANENGEYACTFCEKKYTNKSSFYSHMRSHKKVEEVPKAVEVVGEVPEVVQVVEEVPEAGEVGVKDVPEVMEEEEGVGMMRALLREVEVGNLIELEELLEDEEVFVDAVEELEDNLGLQVELQTLDDSLMAHWLGKRGEVEEEAPYRSEFARTLEKEVKSKEELKSESKLRVANKKIDFLRKTVTKTDRKMIEQKKELVKTKKLLLISEAKLKQSNDTVKVLQSVLNKQKVPEKKEEVIVIEEEVYKCKQCPEIFKTKYGMASHIQLLHKEVPYHCDICNKSLPNRKTAVKHTQEVHSIVARETDLECGFCAKLILSVEEYKVHMEKSHKEGEKEKEKVVVTAPEVKKRETLCINGPQCTYRRQERCKFSHPEVQEENRGSGDWETQRKSGFNKHQGKEHSGASKQQATGHQGANGGAQGGQGGGQGAQGARGGVQGAQGGQGFRKRVPGMCDWDGNCHRDICRFNHTNGGRQDGGQGDGGVGWHQGGGRQHYD